MDRHDSRKDETPQGQTERILAGIWSEVLKVGSVGRRDNFFELGGQSAQGMMLLERIAERFAFEPPFVTIFQYPTVEAMAQLLDKLGNDTLEPRAARSANAE